MSDTTQPSNTTPTDQQDPSEDNSNNQTQDNKKKPRTGPKRRKVTHGKIMSIKKHLLSLFFFFQQLVFTVDAHIWPVMKVWLIYNCIHLDTDPHSQKVALVNVASSEVLDIYVMMK